MLRNVAVIIIGVGSPLVTSFAVADFPDDMRALAQQWANARYETIGDERKTKLAAAIKSADDVVQKYPDRADSHLWAGVVRCSLAEIENKLTALGLAKECRNKLEQSLAIDPNAEDGYAYGVLGTLYAKVPGWPLAFGDKKKADEFLQKSVAIAPAGMNANYFYAKFLFDQGDIARARIYIEHAAAATPPYSPEESLAVAVRLREIRALGEKINAAAPQP